MLLLWRDTKPSSELQPGPVQNMSASPFTRVTRFVPSSHKIVQFSEGQPERQPTDKVVYVDGGLGEKKSILKRVRGGCYAWFLLYLYFVAFFCFLFFFFFFFLS